MFTRMTPILPVADVKVELRFYQSLGFAQYVDPSEVYPVDDFAAVASGTSILFGLAKHDEPSEVPPRGLVWQFETADIDELHRVASSAGVPITVPVTLQPWGRRTLAVTSPNGYVINFEEC